MSLSPTPLLLALALAVPATAAQAADDPKLNQAFQDHVAYVATFAMPVLIEKCSVADAGYLQRAAPLYFRYVNAHQDQIERGRMLTLAELGPDETVRSYRESTIARRLGALDNGVVSVQASVQDGGRTYEIPLEDIASARLVFEFGPASKPGKPGGTKSQDLPGRAGVPGRHEGAGGMAGARLTDAPFKLRRP